MAYEALKIDIDSDGIALVTIDLPGKSMNVWDATLMTEFAAWVDEFVSDDNIKGPVITSGKKSGFLAGADLNMLGSGGTGGKAPTTPEERFESAFGLNRVLRKLETSGHPAKALLKGEAHAKPVAAAVNGLALGGGLELVLACHHRVVADNPKIQLGVPEVQVGLLPGAGGTQRIPRLAGLQNAAMLATQGRPIDPNTAKGQGIIQEVVPADEVVAKAKEWVKANPKAIQPWDKKGFKFPGGGGAMDPRSAQFFMAANAMAQRETNHNYPAVQAILSCFYEGSIVPFDTAIKIESKYFMKLLSGPTARNMIRTLFINKQAAEKGEQRPEGVPPTELKKVGVLGAGMMGAGIAYVTAKGGAEVVLLDRDLDYAQKGKGYSEKIVEKGVSRGKVSKEKGEALLARITPTTDYNVLKDVDLIIEAVFEDITVKKQVIENLNDVVRDDTIVATNTSFLDINEIASVSSHPENVIGLHFFSPAHIMPLLEIVRTEKSDLSAIATALNIAKRIGKKPVVSGVCYGFIANRMSSCYGREAGLLLLEGASVGQVDQVMYDFGMPMGMFSMLDMAGIDIGVGARTKLDTSDYDERAFSIHAALVEKGYAGQKSGAGFYTYDGEKIPNLIVDKLSEELAAKYGVERREISQQEIEERCVFALVNEGFKIVDEGIAQRTSDIDVVYNLGFGFPRYKGGPLHYAEHVGLNYIIDRINEFAKTQGPRWWTPSRLLLELAEKGSD